MHLDHSDKKRNYKQTPAPTSDAILPDSRQFARGLCKSNNSACLTAGGIGSIQDFSTTVPSILGTGLDSAAPFNSMSNSALVRDLDELQRLQDAGVSVDHRFAEVERRLRELRDAVDDERGLNASARDGLESTLLHLRRDLEAQGARREAADGETLERVEALAGLLSDNGAQALLAGACPAPADMLEGLQEVMQSVDALHRRLQRVESHGSLEDLRARLRSTEGILEAQIGDLRATLKARGSELRAEEQRGAQGDDAEVLRSELAALREATRSRHEGIIDRVFATEQRTQEAFDEAKTALEAHCDRLFRDAAETQTRELKRSQALWQSEINAQVQIERSARETWQGAFQDRVSKLEQRLHEDLHQESELRERDFAELRELISHEAVAREVQHRGCQEMLGAERVARESHEASVRGCLASLRSSSRHHALLPGGAAEGRLAAVEGAAAAAAAAASAVVLGDDTSGAEGAASAEKADDPKACERSLDQSVDGGPLARLTAAPERVGKDVLCELRQELQQELRQMGVVQQAVEATLDEERTACVTRHASTVERLLDCEVALEELPAKQAGLVKTLVVRECLALRDDLAHHVGQVQLARKSDRDTYLEFLAREKAAREELLAGHERHRTDTRTRLDILEHLVNTVSAETSARDYGYNAENLLPPASARLQTSRSQDSSRQPSPSRASRALVPSPPVAHSAAVQLLAPPAGRASRSTSAQVVAPPVMAAVLSNSMPARARGAPVVAASTPLTPRAPPVALPPPRSGDWTLVAPQAPRVVERGDDRSLGWPIQAQRSLAELTNSSM